MAQKQKKPRDPDKDYDECLMCGGSGLYDGECECGEDSCCCLELTPVTCPQCGGAGFGPYNGES